MKRVSRSLVHRQQGFIVAMVLVALLLAGFIVAGYIAYQRVVRGTPASPASIAQQNAMPLTPLQCVAKLPTAFLVGQTLMIGLKAGDLSKEAALFKQYDIGGAAIMTAPQDPYDGSILKFKRTAASNGVSVLTATDEEGGYVQRFDSLGVVAAPADVARSMSAAQAQEQVSRHGKELLAIGIDMVFGPLADVAPSDSASPLGNRIFSSDPSVVIAYDRAYINGWKSAGLLPTLKHFPGLGSATGNTDYVPATTPPLSSLQQRDFMPYTTSTAATGTAVMVGNQNVPGWFKGPASLSAVPIAYLRDQLGFKDNLVVTDSLDARAITSTNSEQAAAVKALLAGNDIILFVREDTGLASNRVLISNVVAAIKSALAKGTIGKETLETAVVHKLAAQHIDPCSLL